MSKSKVMQAVEPLSDEITRLRGDVTTCERILVRVGRESGRLRYTLEIIRDAARDNIADGLDTAGFVKATEKWASAALEDQRDD